MKKLITFIAAGVFALSMAMTSFAGSWQRNNVGWWYQNDNGTWPAACWQQINGAWYYFNPAGYMLENTTTPDGYYVGADGAWIPGGQPAAQTTQAIDYSALGDCYHYAYSLDAAGNEYQENRTDLYILTHEDGNKRITFDGQTWELYFHPRTNGRVFGRVTGTYPDIQIFYDKADGAGNVTLWVNGQKTYYQK